MRSMVNHLMEQGSSKPQDRNTVPADRRVQVFQRCSSGRIDCKPRSVQQSAPDLPGGGIKGKSRHLKKSLYSGQIGKPVVLDQPNHSTMRHSHTLWHSG